MIKRKILENNKQGFALLFAVLVSSLLLTIGLSIFSLTLKELAISTSARQSIYAFFAADSGREKALYQDIKVGTGLSFDSGQATFSGNVSVEDGPNFQVTVSKDISNPEKVMTTIQSKGYDSTADDRVERAIEQTY